MYRREGLREKTSCELNDCQAGPGRGIRKVTERRGSAARKPGRLAGTGQSGHHRLHLAGLALRLLLLSRPGYLMGVTE